MRLDYARIDDAAGGLRDSRSGDIYFNPQAGFSESEHVFIRGNRLAERFAALGRAATFSIGETGFGSGMNCLLAARCFLDTAPADARLIYISCEKYPIALADLRRIHSGWPDAALREALYRHYPHCRRGFHWLALHPRIDLLLLWGDANELLPELQAKTDAWFLDGFAPSKDASLWSPTVFAAIAANSRPQATLASFSVARQVRDGLSAAGFALHKQPGFGRKRDMLSGRLAAPPAPAAQWTALPPPIARDKGVKIVGAGLAGLASAHALARRGIAVEVYHSPQRPAASRVPIALPYLQPGREDTPMRRFQLAAWRYGKGFLSDLSARFAQQPFFHAQDIVLKAEDAAAAARHRAIIAGGVFSEDECRLDGEDNLILLGSGSIDTPQLLAVLAQNPLIRLIEQEISPQDLCHWQADSVILASAWHQDLLPAAWQGQLRPLRGQACIARLSPAFADQAVCARYSLLPFADTSRLYIGSAYQPNCEDDSIRPADNARLLEYVRGEYRQYDCTYDSAFAGVRAASRDYLPFIGPLPDARALREAYAPWAFDSRRPIAAAPAYPRPIYLHAGLGSKGCLTAFYGAEILAAMLLDTPLPLPRSLLPHLLPARSLIRAVIRRR